MTSINTGLPPAQITILTTSKIVKGDSIFIHYKDTIVEQIDIPANGEIINYRYAKIYKDKKAQLIEDNLRSKKMHMYFYDTSPKSNINLIGMAETKLNVIQDTLLQGLNHASGDSIIIGMVNKIEIWNPKKLNQTDKENLKLDPDVFEDLAEKIIL